MFALKDSVLSQPLIIIMLLISEIIQIWKYKYVFIEVSSGAGETGVKGKKKGSFGNTFSDTEFQFGMINRVLGWMVLMTEQFDYI